MAKTQAQDAFTSRTEHSSCLEEPLNQAMKPIAPQPSQLADQRQNMLAILVQQVQALAMVVQGLQQQHQAIAKQQQLEVSPRSYYSYLVQLAISSREILVLTNFPLVVVFLAMMSKFPMRVARRNRAEMRETPSLLVRILPRGSTYEVSQQLADRQLDDYDHKSWEINR